MCYNIILKRFRLSCDNKIKYQIIMFCFCILLIFCDLIDMKNEIFINFIYPLLFQTLPKHLKDLFAIPEQKRGKDIILQKYSQFYIYRKILLFKYICSGNTLSSIYGEYLQKHIFLIKLEKLLDIFIIFLGIENSSQFHSVQFFNVQGKIYQVLTSSAMFKASITSFTLRVTESGDTSQ